MMFFLVLGLLLLKSQCTTVRNVYSNHWAVRIAGGPGEADQIAAKYGYTNLGQVIHTLEYLNIAVWACYFQYVSYCDEIKSVRLESCVD